MVFLSLPSIPQEEQMNIFETSFLTSLRQPKELRILSSQERLSLIPLRRSSGFSG